jgi:hypothetical protein
MSVATLPISEDLEWHTPEIPVGATDCPVDWCNGLHDAANTIGETHGTDIISATRDGKLVLEVSVSQWFSFGKWRLLNGRTVTEMPRKAIIAVYLYNVDGPKSKACFFDTPDEAERVNRIFTALGQHELATAITEAIRIARLANRRIPR